MSEGNGVIEYNTGGVNVWNCMHLMRESVSDKTSGGNSWKRPHLF